MTNFVSVMGHSTDFKHELRLRPCPLPRSKMPRVPFPHNEPRRTEHFEIGHFLRGGFCQTGTLLTAFLDASQLERGSHETCDQSDGELEGTRRGRRTRRRGKSKHSGLVSVRQIAAKVCRQLEFLPERDEWAQSVVQGDLTGCRTGN